MFVLGNTILGGTFLTGFWERDTILHYQHYCSTISIENLISIFSLVIITTTYIYNKKRVVTEELVSGHICISMA